MQTGAVVGESLVGCRFTIGQDDLRRAFAAMRHVVGETITCRVDDERLTVVAIAKTFQCEADISYVEKPEIPKGMAFTLIFKADLFSRVLCGQQFGSRALDDLADPGPKLQFRCRSEVSEPSDMEAADRVWLQIWRVVLGTFELDRVFEMRPGLPAEPWPQTGEPVRLPQLVDILTELVPFAQPDQANDPGWVHVTHDRAVGNTRHRAQLISGMHSPGITFRMNAAEAKRVRQAIRHYTPNKTLMQQEANSIIFYDGRHRCRARADWPVPPLPTRPLPPGRSIWVQTRSLLQAIGNVLRQGRALGQVRFQILEADPEVEDSETSLAIEVDLPGNDTARSTCPCTIDPSPADTAGTEASLPSRLMIWSGTVRAKDLSKLIGDKSSSIEVRVAEDRIILVSTVEGTMRQTWIGAKRQR